MQRVAVLLRGVNVGGSNRIAMADLRAVLTGLGCADVQTYLQSGNAVVTAPATGLAGRVEQALLQDLDLRVRVLTRTAAEVDAVVDGNPFDPDPTLLHAVFLDGPAPELPDVSPDRASLGDRVLYARYVSGSQRSPLAKVLSSRRFPPASARNWRTVLALQGLLRREVPTRTVRAAPSPGRAPARRAPAGP